jgi:ribosomal-protein-alanine N-acetyltransferase
MLKDQQEAQVAAIPQRNWFRDLLDRSGFRQTNEVITMIWDGTPIPSERALPGIRLRRMQPSDLEIVQQVDAAAFKPAWRNSLTTLTKAYEQAATATVAEDEQGVVAYQISSITPVGGHLSRLATHPRKQGRGIGSLLVRSLLADFLARGVTQVTVNTQKDNLASISLYSRIGFRPTGEGFPYYQYP